jgi:hypothetical protein
VASRVAISYGCPALFQNAIWTSASYTEKYWVLELNLRTTGSLLRAKSPGETWTSEVNVNCIRVAFQWSPRKSIRAESLQLTNSTFKSAPCAIQKAPPESIR